jgi:hypothetical protein
MEVLLSTAQRDGGRGGRLLSVVLDLGLVQGPLLVSVALLHLIHSFIWQMPVIDTYCTLGLQSCKPSPNPNLLLLLQSCSVLRVRGTR